MATKPWDGSPKTTLRVFRRKDIGSPGLCCAVRRTMRRQQLFDLVDAGLRGGPRTTTEQQIVRFGVHGINRPHPRVLCRPGPSFVVQASSLLLANGRLEACTTTHRLAPEKRRPYVQ